MKDIFTRVLQYEYCQNLCRQLGQLGAKLESIGRSVKGREIPLLRIGNGKRKILYVATTHAAESVTGSVLLRFAYDLLTQPEIDAIATQRVFRQAQLLLIPLLNPDGVEIAQNCISDQDRPRLLFFNDGKEDFSAWQANDHGVDLNHNFDADFAAGAAAEKELGIYGPSPTRYGGKAPFSEPETAALRDCIIRENIDMFFALHTQGEEMYPAGKGALSIARILAKTCGYQVTQPEGIACYRGAKDWFCQTFDRPGFTMEMGKGKNPLPVSDGRGIYRKCGEMLMLSTIIS